MVLTRPADLIAADPLGSLLVLFTAVLLLGHFIACAFQRQGSSWSWLSTLLASLSKTSLVLGLIFLSVVLLRSFIQVSQNEYGAYSRVGTAAWRAWQEQSRDRALIRQEDLSINFFTTSIQTRQIPPSTLAGPPLFEDVIVRQEVEQNSIASFSGTVQLTSQSPELVEGPAFNTYTARASLNYTVTNRLAEPVEAEFSFPLAGAPVLYRSVRIQVDGQDLTGELALQDGDVRWKKLMSPGQSVLIGIEDQAEGVDGYLFSIPSARELNAFSFTIESDRPGSFPVTYPDTVSLQTSTVQGWSTNFWWIDRAVMAPTLGLFYVQGRPYAPYDGALNVLQHIPRAFLLLAVVVVLTLLIHSQKVNLVELLLFSGLELAPPLAIMGSEPLLAHFRIVLPLLVVATLGPAFLIFRKHSTPSWISIVVWTAILLGGYPFVGLFSQVQILNSVETIVFSAVIVYAIGSILAVRLLAPNKAN